MIIIRERERERKKERENWIEKMKAKMNEENT